MALHRDAKILVFTRALRSFGASALVVVFPIYLSKLGATPVEVGLTFTGISLMAALKSLLEGLVADRLGRKPVLLYTAALMVLGGLVFVLSDDIGVLMSSAVVSSVGSQLDYTPAEQAMLAEKVLDRERLSAFSINAFLGTFASIFGSLSAALPEFIQAGGVGEIASYKPLFVMFTALGVVTFGLFAVVEETVKRGGQREALGSTEEDRGARALLLKWSAVYAVDMVGGSFIMSLQSYWFYLRFDVGLGSLSLIQGASQFCSTISFALGLKMARSVGTIKAITLSRIPNVLGNVATPLMPSFAAAAALRIFMSLFSLIDIPLKQSYLMGVIKGRQRASAAGVVNVVSKVTSAGSPSVSGYFFEFVSLAVPFYAAASLQLASAGMLYLVFKGIRPPEERSGV